MVDWYGRWSYVPGTPENEKCLMDHVADAVAADAGPEYKFETSIEWVSELVFLFYEEHLKDSGAASYCEAPEMSLTEDMRAYVEDSGGVKEFDFAA